MLEQQQWKKNSTKNGYMTHFGQRCLVDSAVASQLAAWRFAHCVWYSSPTAPVSSCSQKTCTFKSTGNLELSLAVSVIVCVYGWLYKVEKLMYVRMRVPAYVDAVGKTARQGSWFIVCYLVFLYFLKFGFSVLGDSCQWFTLYYMDHNT